jgi:crossover junction endodeoxyribonuclease RusA
MGCKMQLDLPYPHKALWPNGRAHHFDKHRRFKAHRWWAVMAAKEAGASPTLGDGLVAVAITCYGRAKGPLPDADNVVAAAKAYIDGIAAAIGVDDKHFAAPTVAYGATRTARFVIKVGI